MHLLLTDRLICPRCGPDFGLILWSDQTEERRVLAGHLGCANCRERYPVLGGFADLRPAPRSPEPEAPHPASSGPEGLPLGEPIPESGATEALRVAALLGLDGEGVGAILLTGRIAHLGREIAAHAEGWEVVAEGEALRLESEGDRVSRIRVGGILPFRGGSFRGVVLELVGGDPSLVEGVRVLARRGRLLLPDPPAEIQAELAGLGFRVLLHEARWLLAEKG